MTASKGNQVSLEAIKALRAKTSASLNDVREALTSSGGDEKKALEALRKRGADIALKRHDRSTGQGRIEVYTHHDGKLGSIVEVQCETDFVARTPEFIAFCKDLAMHVAAMAPESVDSTEGQNLLSQPFVKDSGITISDFLKELIVKTGEKVVIQRFERFVLGDSE